MCLCVCVFVCPYKVLRDSESLGKSAGKKWYQNWTFLQQFCWTGGFCKLVKLHFLVFFALQSQCPGLDRGCKFKSQVWTSRLKLRLSIVESWYRDWNQDFWNLRLDIETGIETLKSWVLISRLESRLLRSQSWYRDWYQYSKNRGGSLWSRLSRESLLISGLAWLWDPRGPGTYSRFVQSPLMIELWMEECPSLTIFSNFSWKWRWSPYQD